MRHWLLPILCLWAITTTTGANINHDSNLDWYTIQTDHYRFHFHDSEEHIVQAFWPQAERMFEEITRQLNWVPADRIDVVFTDEFDVSNGFARVFPRTNMNIFVSAPDSINSLEDHHGWLELVFRHELLHVIHLDKARGAPLVIRKIFGRQPLVFPPAFPNAMQPLWYIEGLATYVETDIEQGVGRGQSTYYDMLMRMEVMGGVKPLRQVNQPIGTWPAGTIRYLYGVHYHNFIRDRYGDEKIWQLVEGFSDNIVPYRIDSNTANVFRKNHDEMWREFTQYLNEKYNAQIEIIRKDGLHEGRVVSSDGYVADSVVALDDQVFYTAFNFRSHPALMMSQAGKAPVKLRDVNAGARLAIHRDKGILITQPEPCRNARFYYEIYRVDLDGSNYRRLTDCGRYRHATWSAKGDRIIAVKTELGINSLDLLDDQAHLIDTLWRGEDGAQIGGMTYSPSEDKLVVSVWRQHMGWNLELFDLTTRQWQAITADNHIQAHPVYSADGQSILYTSDESGVYNLYRLNLSTGQRSRLSNVLGGALYPAQAGSDLFYIGYSPDGANLYQIADSQATAVKPLKITKVTPVAAAKPEPVINKLPVEDYSPLSTIAPTWWLPFIQLDDQRTELGIQTAGSDALDRHLYSTLLAVDVENEWLVGRVDYLYDGLWPILHLGYVRETDIFLDGSDNTQRIRDDRRLILEAITPFFSADSGLFIHTGIIRQHEKDLWRADGVAPQSDFREDLAGIGVRYVSANRYPLSVSRSEGRDVRLVYEDSDAIGDSTRKGQVTVAEWREFLHIGREHVAALRLVEGHGRNNPEQFRLGGIQFDYSLFGSLISGGIAPIFDKREYTLRGYDEGHPQLRNKNMRLISAEYRFPIWRIERGFMAPPIGINQLHGTVFYDVGGVWGDNASGPDEYYAGAGFEINTDLDLLYNFRLNLSLGFATGFDDVIGEDQVYLRIGSQF